MIAIIFFVDHQDYIHCHNQDGCQYHQAHQYILNFDDNQDPQADHQQVKEVAKLHAISFCMKEGNCENLFERFPTLREDR